MDATILEIAADGYHADLIAAQPTLSASLAHILCTSSPAHARAAHPKLNPNWQRHEEDKFDVGTAAHALILQGETVVEVVDATDWRTAAAKAQRDDARAAGRIPLLAKHWQAVSEMADAIRDQAAVLDVAPPLFADGKPEQTLVWEDRFGVICRARLDWLHDDRSAIDDLKTTARSANPEGWTRSTLYSIGADIQTAFYLRGLKAVTGKQAEFRFCVVETAPPYALAVVSLGPASLELANKKVDYALETWATCLRNDAWPAYDRRVHFAELPAWEEARWLGRELREVAA